MLTWLVFINRKIMYAQECHKEKEKREFVAIDIGSRGYRGKEKQLINKGEEK